MTKVRRVSPPAASRPAFTLVELMVVLAIIGVLAALVAAAVTKVIPSQQQRNTERTIQKLNGELMAHWRAVIDDAKEGAKVQANALPTMRFAGNPPDPERARILWIKLRLAQQFPMSYYELLTPTASTGLTIPPADSSYAARLKAAGITIANAPTRAFGVLPPPEEVATCLYIALTAKSHRGKTTQEDSFNADERGSYVPLDANGNPLDTQRPPRALPMIVDSWGKPISFFRWAAYDPFKSGSAATGGADPLDPTARLSDTTWQNWLGANSLLTPTQFTIKHPLQNPQIPFGVQFSNYLLPVVVSAGQDGDLGMADYWMKPAAGPGPADNIYSYLLK